MGLALYEPRSLTPAVGTLYLAAKLHRPGGIIDISSGVYLLALVDPSAQFAGLVVLMAGLVSPGRWSERDGAIPSVTVVPGVAGAPLGASLVGRL